MLVPEPVMKQLDVDAAAEFCLGTPLDRMPLLISDRSLAGSGRLVAKSVRACYQGGSGIPTEIITMPKSRLGQRPVICTSVEARVIYHALVSAIEQSLGAPSRADGAWERHEQFAISSHRGYIVAFDIAACYEFIDHARLRQELIAVSLEHGVSNSITDFLRECSPNNRGLPQLTAASDFIADAYLSVLERQLARRGLALSRFADDFLVRVESWDEAMTTIEFAAEYARELGLILAYEKTKVERPEAIRGKRKNLDRLQKKYFDSERERLTFYEIVGNGVYGNSELVKIAPSDVAALKESMRRVANDWLKRAHEQRHTPEQEAGNELVLRRLVPLALSVLEGDEKRVADEVLTELIKREPIRLERVCKYVLGRASRQEECLANWRTLRELTQKARTSPWAKIWLLHTVAAIPRASSADYDAVQQWVGSQLLDRHEVVRAEATWSTAVAGQLTGDVIFNVLRDASPVSQAGVAAAVGRQGKQSAALINSITSQSPIAKAAYEWGGQQ